MTKAIRVSILPIWNGYSTRGHQQWWVPTKLSNRWTDVIIPRGIPGETGSPMERERVQEARGSGAHHTSDMRGEETERAETWHPHSPWGTISNCLVSGSESNMNKSKCHCLGLTEEVRHTEQPAMWCKGLWEKKMTSLNFGLCSMPSWS